MNEAKRSRADTPLRLLSREKAPRRRRSGSRETILETPVKGSAPDLSDTTLELVFDPPSRPLRAERARGRQTETRRLLKATGLGLLLWTSIGLALSLVEPFGIPNGGEERPITEISIELVPSAASLPPEAAPMVQAVRTPPTISAPEPKAAPLAALPVTYPVLPTAEEAPAETARAETPSAALEAAEPVPEQSQRRAVSATPDEGAAAAASSASNGSPIGAPRIRTISPSTLALLNAAIQRNLKYPQQARRRNIEGKVEIDIAVGADGSLAECALAGSSGSGILDEAALRLLRGLFPLTGAEGNAFSTRVAIDYRLR